MATSYKIIGIDLGATQVKGAIFNGDKKVASNIIATAAQAGDDAVIENILLMVESLVDLVDGDLDGVGIAVPGLIDSNSGIVIESPNFRDFRSVKLTERLQTLIGVPVFIDNDANLYAIAEQKVGVAKNYKNFLLLTLGTGIGGALFINDELFYGESFKAAEIGHLKVRSRGRRCGCGSTGCLEQYGSATAVKRAAAKLLKSNRSDWVAKHTNSNLTNLDSFLIYQGAKEGDSSCLEIFEDAGREIGIAIGAVALLLDIKHYLIGGGMADALEFMQDNIYKYALKSAFNLKADELKIVKTKLGIDAACFGAMLLVNERLKEEEH